MTDIEDTPEGTIASRRALLKGAVGAGVGLAAWSAPKIGSIPAYALTSSTGVFNGTCYYLQYVSRTSPARERWARPPLTSPGRPDAIDRLDTGTPGYPQISFDARFRWNAIFPDGSNLVVRATGDPRGTGVGSIVLETAPAGCGFDTDATTSNAKDTSDYVPDISGGTCNPSGTDRAATYTWTSATEIQLTGVVQDSLANVVHFNIRC